MNRGVYAITTGMTAAQQWMDVQANNLANVSTTGFKQDGMTFQDLLARDVNGANGRGGRVGTVGAGAAVTSEFTNFQPGKLRPTGNPLDLAIEGTQGMFAVMSPSGIKYTRDGTFGLDAQSRLIDRNGNPVLDDRQSPILLSDPGPVSVASDGTISQDGRTVGRIGVWVGQFTKAGGNDFTGTNTQAVTDPRVRQGALEESNVSPITSMTEMIRMGRHFELSQRMVQTDDDMTGKLLDVIRN